MTTPHGNCQHSNCQHAHRLAHSEVSSIKTAQSLREQQGPIKAAYRDDPSTALVTLRSTGSLDSTTITCKLSTGAGVKSASKVAGLHPKAGGSDPDISGELCSGDMLLDALVACAGVTLKAVATALGIPVQGGTVMAEGDMDFRGTLGVDKTAPVGITDIRLGFDLHFGEKEDGSPITEEDVERLGKLTERYCVVLQTLVRKPNLAVRVIGKGGGEEDGIERHIVWGQKI
ncbi:OsmC family protein-like protein [Lindgomyces ingoldianus]|uniref:OsmC family protein-like protein n=1 Tax=Lindgomyces ingoldianus TaxID=673940 RepID=A0ACB6QBL8_9PLEO|nr:OsmC family protein-like protein [Lindgomyces ingoldianus]KAF2464291.1 OsmC family protein-like protein [Lindgomyces ingoldianus]